MILPKLPPDGFQVAFRRNLPVSRYNRSPNQPRLPVMTNHTLFATCPRGLETILAQELADQGCTHIAPTDGGVSCQGSLEAAYRANLHSRTASRILLQLAKQPYRSEDDIYRAAKSIRWEDWFHAGQTFKIKVEGKRARVKSLDFTALKIKDGLCDRFRSSQGQRPSVDKADPHIRIHAFISEQHAAIFIDTSGEALFKRGYRQDTGAAPLRENLAAASPSKTPSAAAAPSPSKPPLSPPVARPASTAVSVLSSWTTLMPTSGSVCAKKPKPPCYRKLPSPSPAATPTAA